MLYWLFKYAIFVAGHWSPTDLVVNSEDANKFVSSLLKSQTELRMSVDAATDHRWLKGSRADDKCQIYTAALREYNRFVSKYF